MIYHREIIQRTSEWDAIRLGRITASALADLMPAKSKPDDSWTDTQSKILYTIAAERLTGQKKDGFETRAIQWGRDTESLARAVYEIFRGVKIEEVGFIERDEYVGCSPDGLVGEHGLVEIKCPNSDTHLQYRTIEGRLAEEYKWQVQGQLWVSGRAWCDLCSFDPRYTDPFKRLFVVRIERDEAAIARIESRVTYAIEAIKTLEAA